MAGFLLDTNVVSEWRKKSKMNPHVWAWTHSVPLADLYLSVLVVGELHKGVASHQRRDPVAARSIDAWVNECLQQFTGRILPITEGISVLWGQLSVPNPLPVVDGLLAATCLVHQLTLVTRNTKDVIHIGVPIINPFDPI